MPQEELDNYRLEMIKEVFDKLTLEKPILAPDYVWNAYATI